MIEAKFIKKKLFDPVISLENIFFTYPSEKSNFKEFVAVSQKY